MDENATPTENSTEAAESTKESSTDLTVIRME